MPRHRLLFTLPSLLFILAPEIPLKGQAAALAQDPSAFPAAPLPPAEPWQPVEQIKTYSIRGKTGIDLYRSIGALGPAAGVPAIAHTTFKLTWTRDYRPQPDQSCVLAVAKPKLIITYTLPRVSHDLPPAVAAAWAKFRAGVEKHERVHGEQIIDMVRGIERFSRGLTAEQDPQCLKVRERLQARLKEFSDERVRQSREFDEVELTNGGAVHQLILKLVNGS
jgi:predicted secreted Zn-dependent protease